MHHDLPSLFLPPPIVDTFIELVTARYIEEMGIPTIKYQSSERSYLSPSLFPFHLLSPFPLPSLSLSPPTLSNCLPSPCLSYPPSLSSLPPPSPKPLQCISYTVTRLTHSWPATIDSTFSQSTSYQLHHLPSTHPYIVLLQM